jgi:two-component system cell cycle response regulator
MIAASMRILIADDEAVSRRMLEGALEQLGYEVTVCADGRQALDALLADDGPRLAILDWMMPGVDGLEVCRRVRSSAGHYVYVIILTSRDRREDVLAAYDAEADDFLVKPFDALELRARLRSGERVLALQERLLAIQEELRHEATRDPLTGLWNRRMILEQLAREFHRAMRDGHAIAVTVADLDHFKDVNDRHGHAMGDAALRAASERLRSVLRSYDFIGRYGGEEFLIILPGCEPHLALSIAERARRAMSSPLVVDGKELNLSVSLGVACSTPDTTDPSALIHAADQALYRAKAAGRDRIEIQTTS